MNNIRIAAFTGLMLVLAGPAQAERVFEKYQTAVLQGLDKPNARVQTLEVKVGQETHFGPLSIMVRGCRKTTPEDEPESAAFLEISDERAKDAQAQMVYKGWMFASSPALSALEHPIYDVWVLDCKNPIAPPPSEEPAAAPANPPPAAKSATPPAKAPAKKP